MYQTTHSNVPGKEVEKMLGRVEATSLGSGARLKAWKLESLMVMAKMQGFAWVMGADAIINTRFWVKDIGGGVIAVYGCGEAVVFKSVDDKLNEV